MFSDDNLQDSSSADDLDDCDDDNNEKLNVCYQRLFPGSVKIEFNVEKAESILHAASSEEEIGSNERKFICEDEKGQRKVNKKAAKKKRRKARKKMEKQEQPQQQVQASVLNSDIKETGERDRGQIHMNNSRSSSCEHDVDSTTCSSNALLIEKNGNTDIQYLSRGDSNDQDSLQNSDDEIEEIDSTVLQSRQLAFRGNEMAQMEEYSTAIELFTEAIALDPTDFRFLCNRSYCYERQKQYEKAMRDADRAIKLSEDWPKGYFRKGKGLAGLCRLPEAEQCFRQVLVLDKDCMEAREELRSIQIRQLTEIGFSFSQAHSAILKHGDTNAAVEFLLSLPADDSWLDEVYMSEEDSTQHPSNQSQCHALSASHQIIDSKMDPQNPDGETSLWVGNILPQVREKRLLQLFSKYGPIDSIRQLPDRRCAFVNFQLKDSAGRAMQRLQGHDIDGESILIRYTSKWNTSSVKKGSMLKMAVIKNPTFKSDASSTVKLPRPVNGDECYFWRTNGYCIHSDDCRFRHEPKSKGIDRRQ